MNRDDHIAAWKAVLLAGLAGGAAEILWVTLYSAVTATSGTTVARQVTASIWSAGAAWTFAPALGIVIHLALSIALAAAVVWTLWRFAPRLGADALAAGAIAVLSTVWAVNFFVVLPALNPAFVTLMPYAATLFSKMLFGIAMAWVFQQTACLGPQRTTARNSETTRQAV